MDKLEFKDYGKILQAHVDQVDAYARDLKHYHAGSQLYTVLPILVLARTSDLIQKYDGISVVSANTIGRFLEIYNPLDTPTLIDPIFWISADYPPLPSLIQAARTIWDKQPLPQITRALSAGIPQTIADLINIARIAKQNKELHLALVTGVPGAGKTLVGIQLVYENHLNKSDIKNNAVHQLRVNRYRVLLTRERDGFIIFVPNEIGMKSTYEALKGGEGVGGY